MLVDRWRDQLSELLTLCARAPIEEVMLMEQSHQVISVPFSLAKHRAMSDIYLEYAAQLRRASIGYSVNIATLVGHSDAPSVDDVALPFERFVGEDLTPLNAVYCMSDPDWVDYAREVVALYAATHPERLMVDDDFRSLNHTVSTGCFCTRHAVLTAEALGQSSLTSRELRDAILRDDDRALEVKSAWQRVNAAIQVRAAAAIERAVHTVDPSIHVGLMNSGEPSHSLQGRDMRTLLQTFAGTGREILSRPAGGAYSDCLHEDIVAMHQAGALSREAAGGRGVWVSEVENWPHSRYTKSVAITRLQMLLHTLWGANAITLNLYDYLGTPFEVEPEWERLLAEVKPELERLAERRRGRTLRGVGIPWKADVARFHRNRSRTVEGLMPRRALDNLLPLLGVPIQFTSSEHVNIILGDDVEAFGDDEIESMLAAGLLIDHVAALHLEDRGFGEHLGGRITGTIVGPAVEWLTNPRFAGQYTDCRLPTDWFRLEARGEWIAEWSPFSSAEIVSTYYDDAGLPLSPAITVFANSFGGRVAVMAQSVHDQGWLHAGRAAQIRALVRWLAGAERPWPIVDQGPNVAPFVYRDQIDGSDLVVLVNAGLDAVRVETDSLSNVDSGTDGIAGAVTLQPLQLWSRG